MPAQAMIELWRGGRLESAHVGHAVICDASGAVVEAWGEADALIYPRSSCKMIQALPLVESGAADAAGLDPARLALACASHSGGHVHTDTVTKWLEELGLGEPDLRCGSHMPRDKEAMKELICSETAPCQIHNNCSGKHAGFLTLTKHMGAGPEYVDLDHPVQRSVREAFEDVTGEASPGYGIDGCSAPNFATSVTGLARAMAYFASADGKAGKRAEAAVRLRDAMRAHPLMVAGEGRACTELMEAMGGRVAIKTGAEAVFVAMLPEQKLGIALKIVDGGTRAAEAAITALLAKLGVLDPAHPAALKRLGPERNWRGIETGELRVAEGFV